MAELHSSSCLEYLLWSVVIILGVVICLLLIGYCYSYRKDKKFGLAVAESEPDKITVELLQKQLDSESIQTEPEPIQTDPETLYNNPDIVDKCMAMERELKQYKLILSIKKDFPDMKEADIRSLSVFQSLQKKTCKAVISTSEDWELLFLWMDIAHSRFYSRLREQYGQLKKRDLQICCLMRLGFDHEVIRQILEVHNSTYCTDKSHTKKRLLLERKVSSEDFICGF